MADRQKSWDSGRSGGSVEGAFWNDVYITFVIFELILNMKML